MRITIPRHITDEHSLTRSWHEHSTDIPGYPLHHGTNIPHTSWHDHSTYINTIMARHSTSWHERSTDIPGYPLHHGTNIPHTSWHDHFHIQIHIGISRSADTLYIYINQGGRKLSTRELSWGSLGAFQFLWFAQCRAVIFNYPQVSVLCMPPDSVARNHPTNHDNEAFLVMAAGRVSSSWQITSRRLTTRYCGTLGASAWPAGH